MLWLWDLLRTTYHVLILVLTHLGTAALTPVTLNIQRIPLYRMLIVPLILLLCGTIISVPAAELPPMTSLFPVLARIRTDHSTLPAANTLRICLLLGANTYRCTSPSQNITRLKLLSHPLPFQPASQFSRSAFHSI